MPETRPYLTGRTYIFAVPRDEDLLAFLQEFCRDNQIKCGIVNAIGAVSAAAFSFYDQKKKKYVKTSVERELEILSLCGNVSLLENDPMVHAHVCLADSDGKTMGGHLAAGTKVFACEVFIQELVGTPKIRKSDKSAGLALWQE